MPIALHNANVNDILSDINKHFTFGLIFHIYDHLSIPCLAVMCLFLISGKIFEVCKYLSKYVVTF